MCSVRVDLYSHSQAYHLCHTRQTTTRCSRGFLFVWKFFPVMRGPLLLEHGPFSLSIIECSPQPQRILFLVTHVLLKPMTWHFSFAIGPLFLQAGLFLLRSRTGLCNKRRTNVCPSRADHFRSSGSFLPLNTDLLITHANRIDYLGLL